MENQKLGNEHMGEDEVNVKYIFNKIKMLFILIKFYFWRLLIISFIGGLFGFTLAYLSRPIYIGKVRFLMKEAGGGSALLSSLGSLGSLIGGNGGTTSPLDRTLAILGSERIIGNALLKPIIVNGRSDLAINHFIKIQSLDKEWVEDSLLKDVKFFSKINNNLQTLNLAQRKAYKSVLNLFIRERSIFLGKLYDKKSGIFDLSVKTVSEGFSIEFSKSIYNELNMFMYKQSVSTSEKNVRIIEAKIDSIKLELNNVQNSLARNTDRTLGLIMQEDKIFQKKLIMKEQMLTIMYGEAQKNLETFKFVNESLTTGLEIVEFPFSPIVPTKKSIELYSFLGFLLSGFFSFSFICVRRLISDLI